MRKIYIIGLTEPIEICGENHLAKIDTGASRSSIDKKLAQKLKLFDILKHKEVKSANGSSIRKVVRAKIKIGSRIISTTLNLADRQELKYDLILGKNFLKRGFWIDTTKKNKLKR